MRNIPVRKIRSVNETSKVWEDFNIRTISAVLNEKDMKQDLHRHDFYFIMAVEKGIGIHEVDFTEYKIIDRSIFLMRPGQVHQLELKKNSTGYVIEFKNELYHAFNTELKNAIIQAGHANFYQPDVDTFSRLINLLSNINGEYRTMLDGYQEIIKANLTAFFIELLRLKKSTTQNAKIDSHEQERLEKLNLLIEKNIATLKKPSQYAELLNLSLYQLNSLVNNTLGKSCAQLINEHIILEARRNLLATSNQINEIAYNLGFEDVSYFIRFFKKHTGYSPDAYRQNFK